MSIAISDLSDDQVACLTGLLARRPEYGIAIPSRRWLLRQQEKMQNLPKLLLRPSALLRIAAKIADTIDPDIIDPRAVLCTTHSKLNPFLIRRLFIALAYEVTVHTDPLRSWPGRTNSPEISAFIGRLDSIAALWTEPELFEGIYGLAPFNSHNIFVKSTCEACCLAAVGASGRALADLRAALIDRMERRKEKTSEKRPRIYRFVESWIDHLSKDGEHVGRANECRYLSDTVLVELRMARTLISEWRVEQKEYHAQLRIMQRPIYAELRRGKEGSRITPISSKAGPHRRTRNGIPVALADTNRAEDQKQAALNRGGAESIYRPDSISGDSQVHARQKAARDLPIGDKYRPSAPYQAHVEEDVDDDKPTRAFLHKFEDEIPLHDRRDTPVDLEDDQEPNNETKYVEANRAKVEAWWAHRLAESQLDIRNVDARSVVTMVHPAFRPRSVAVSAIPEPLHTTKNNKAPSVWTDCSVYTVEQPNSGGDVPPVPRIPTPFQPRRESSSHTGSVKSSSSSRSKKGKGKDDTDHKDKAPLNWPAPPHGRPTTATTTNMKQSTPSTYRSSSVYSQDDNNDGRSQPSEFSRRGTGTPATSYSDIMRSAEQDDDDKIYYSESEINPDDSISNVNWNPNRGRKSSGGGGKRASVSASSVTQVDNFKGKM